MADIFRLKNDDGSDGEWAYFSESKGDIVNVGMDESEARSKADLDSPKTTIAQALEGDTSTPAKTPVPPVPTGNENASSLGDSVANPVPDSSMGCLLASPNKIDESETKAKPARERAPLTPVFIKKLVEQLGRNTTNVSIELERFLFRQFGFTTEELAEDDSDVEIIKMGWDAIWQSYLAGKEPPLWMILAFGYSCVSARLIASAKRIEKKEKEHATETTVVD